MKAHASTPMVLFPIPFAPAAPLPMFACATPTPALEKVIALLLFLVAAAPVVYFGSIFVG